MRIFVGISVVILAITGFVHYGVNYATRDLERQVASQEKRLKELRRTMSVLKAERAYLARPERIAPLARALGLEPIKLRQIAQGPHREQTQLLPAFSPRPPQPTR
ncbi:MAG: cell division protein FtsL [Pseudomonadota bacterium]